MQVYAKLCKRNYAKLQVMTVRRKDRRYRSLTKEKTFKKDEWMNIWGQRESQKQRVKPCDA